MENKLNHITLQNFTTESGAIYTNIQLSYETFGANLKTAPIVLVNHALTGNSTVIGKTGWWNNLIGENKTIDITKYAILAFNVPGNGYNNNVIENYKDFTARDIARIFLSGLEILKIDQLYAIIGGSIGGGIAWEMVVIAPKITQNLIPIASDWKSTDWLIANCYLQDRILNNSKNPIQDARIHAMLCYRTPASLKFKFNRTLNQEMAIFNIESWLIHHGKKLQKRFQLSAYKMMNHLLKTIDITRNNGSFEIICSKIEANIYIIAIDSDLFFTPDENKKTYNDLKLINKNAYYKEIKSLHGHDAFLIEYAQLDTLLLGIF